MDPIAFTIIGIYFSGAALYWLPRVIRKAIAYNRSNRYEHDIASFLGPKQYRYVESFGSPSPKPQIGAQAALDKWYHDSISERVDGAIGSQGRITSNSVFEVDNINDIWSIRGPQDSLTITSARINRDTYNAILDAKVKEAEREMRLRMFDPITPMTRTGLENQRRNYWKQYSSYYQMAVDPELSPGKLRKIARPN